MGTIVCLFAFVVEKLNQPVGTREASVDRNPPDLENRMKKNLLLKEQLLSTFMIRKWTGNHLITTIAGA